MTREVLIVHLERVKWSDMAGRSCAAILAEFDRLELVREAATKADKDWISWTTRFPKTGGFWIVEAMKELHAAIAATEEKP